MRCTCKLTKPRGTNGDAKIVVAGKILALGVERGERGQNWALRKSLFIYAWSQDMPTPNYCKMNLVWGIALQWTTINLTLATNVGKIALKRQPSVWLRQELGTV